LGEPLLFRSFSDKKINYQVDTQLKVCSCPVFIGGKHCKHLEALGLYEEKAFLPTTHPSFSQALSGLVKALRVRRVEDAVYWSLYLHRNTDNGARFRFARRLLIGAAEDGHSVSVMEAVSDNFGMLCKQDTPFIRYVAECMRICAVPNWWDPKTNGHDYIMQGLLSWRYSMYEDNMPHYTLPKDEDILWSDLEGHVESGLIKQALVLFWIAIESKNLIEHETVQRLKALTIKYDSPTATKLCDIYLRHKGPLKGDGNFIGQALWTMICGPSAVAKEIQLVRTVDAIELERKAVERWKNPKPIDTWMCDGTHSAGNDRRFRGMWSDMMGVCNAYNHYGRVDPADIWLREFFPLEGLIINGKVV
jgi:hypothetical protein